jgi:uncharacterized membrane protein
MLIQKYLRLLGMILLTMIGVILVVVVMLLLMRLLMGVMDQIPWMLYVYMSIMLTLPTAFFLKIFDIFSKRTRSHPSKWVRWFSQIVFLLSALSWMLIFIKDMVYFVQTGYGDINKYVSYSLTALVPSVFVIFLIGIIQALTTKPELDWMEKNRRRNSQESKSI